MNNSDQLQQRFTPGTKRYGKAGMILPGQHKKRKKNRILARIAKASRKINRVVILLIFPFLLQAQESKITLQDVKVWQVDTIPGYRTLDSFGISKYYEPYQGVSDTVPCLILAALNEKPFIIDGFAVVENYPSVHIKGVITLLDADKKELGGDLIIWNYTLK